MSLVTESPLVPLGNLNRFLNERYKRIQTVHVYILHMYIYTYSYICAHTYIYIHVYTQLYINIDTHKLIYIATGSWRLGKGGASLEQQLGSSRDSRLEAWAPS